ncbi:hypothetical protein HRH25_21755 [Flavisolibacter sp. BT320]|nr:hypothetical protein [Flavisolibacter longurius]
MRQTFYALLFQTLVLITLTFLSCMRPPQRDPFTINDTMPGTVWQYAQSTTDYRRKIEPGTIIHIDCFTATQPYGQSSLMPLHYVFDIPVRMIDTKKKDKNGVTLGKLKNYEKDFLLTYLATNSKKNFGTVPPESSLVNLWNFLMNNLWVIQDTKPNALAKVKVDYTSLNNDLLASDRTFYDQLIALDRTTQEIVVPRQSYPDHQRSFFAEKLVGKNNNEIFYSPALEDRFFSYVSYSVFVDAAFYSKNQSITQLASWSIHDWIYSGVPMHDEDKERILKRIKFKKYGGSYLIVNNDTEPGRRVKYGASSDLMLIGSGDKKTIVEEDLTNIFPPSVKRLIFRKP